MDQVIICDQWLIEGMNVTAIQDGVPSKIQIRQWFVTNYSNSCHVGINRISTIFSLDMNLAKYVLHALFSFRSL